MENTSDREITITRLINAPRERVWEAWTELKHLEQWWGPNGFSVTTESFEMKVGGVWKFVMHGPDGRDYNNFIKFTEIVKPELIRNVHGGDDGDVEFLATITFEAQGDKTLLTMHSLFPTAAERDRVVKEHNAIEGGTQTIGRLAEYVENQ